MSAKFITPQEVDALAAIRELLNANPKDIAAAHEEARKQLALTEEETRKAAEARAFIAQHKVLLANLDAREAAISEKESSYDAKVEAFKQSSETINAGLQLRERELISRMEAHAAVQSKHGADVAKLQVDQAALADLNRNLKARFTKQEEDIAAAKAFNDSEALRLKNLASELRTKAQKQLDSF